jgi:hypothetical protein
MPKFMPLLAASELVHGTLTVGPKDCMRHALLHCKEKTGIGEFRAVARAGPANPHEPDEGRGVCIQSVPVEGLFTE